MKVEHYSHQLKAIKHNQNYNIIYLIIQSTKLPSNYSKIRNFKMHADLKRMKIRRRIGENVEG